MNLKNLAIWSLSLICCVCILSCASQQVSHVKSEAKPTVIQNKERLLTGVFDEIEGAADVLPVFPPGNHQLWLAHNVRYPKQSMERGSQGKVFIRVVIGKDGKVSLPVVTKSSGDSLIDKEALRVASEMPDWIPAEKDGQKISIGYTFPINFKLSF